MPTSRLFCLLIGTAFAFSASAESQDQRGSFNVSWQAYAAAVETRDSRAMLEAAEIAFIAAESELLSDDERYPQVALNYGKLLLNSGDKERAREILDLAIQRYEDHSGADSPRLIPVYLAAADAYRDESYAARQFTYSKKAVDLSGLNDGEASIDYANVLLRAGKGLIDGPRTIHAKKYLTSAYDSYALHLGKDSLQAAESVYHLGLIEYNDHKFRHAEPLFLAALDGFDASNPIGRKRHLMTRQYLVKTYENLGDSGSATTHCVAIGRMQAGKSGGQPEPIHSFAASYPINMLARRREGFVDVVFTVDERGFVRDTRVVLTSGDADFEQAALNAVKRFRYAPTFVNGFPVSTEHVRTRISFKLE